MLLLAQFQNKFEINLISWNTIIEFCLLKNKVSYWIDLEYIKDVVTRSNGLLACDVKVKIYSLLFFQSLMRLAFFKFSAIFFLTIYKVTSFAWLHW